MACFKAKTGRDKLRMREKKYIVPIHSNSTRKRELRKSIKKIQKN